MSRINFSDGLREALATPINISFTSGTIQYLPNPYELLDTVANAGVPIVALTRNNFSLKPIIVAQRSMLSANGTGSHLPEYGNSVIYYPNSSIDKQRLTKIFLDHSYSLTLDTAGTPSGVYGAISFSGDLVFAKT